MSIALEIVGVDAASKPIKTVTTSLEGMERQAEHTGGILSGLTGALGKVGLAGLGIQTAIGAVSGAVGLLTGPIQAASDLSESMNKVDVVFGDSAKVVTDFAKTAAQNLGQSQAAALEAAGTFGNLFVSMGLGQGQAAKLSTEIVGLGSDLASFNNISPTEALDKLRSGLIGEAEPLRSLGVNLNEAMVQDEALRLGLAKTKDGITEAAKVQARYSLILKQTKTAQGDFSRTSTGMANASRIISASLEDLQVQIGNRLLPVVAPLVAAVAKQLPAAMDALGPILDAVGTAIGGVSQAFLGFWRLVSPLVGSITRALTGELEVWRYAFGEGGLGGILEQAADDLSSGRLLGALLDLRQRIVAQLATWGAAFVAWITPMLPTLAKQVLAIADTVVAQILAAVPLLAQQFAGWVDAFVDWAILAGPPLLAALGDVATQIVGWIEKQAPVLIDTLLGQWLPAALSWVIATAEKIGPELGKLFVAIVDWIEANGPNLLEKFVGEWVPAAIVWVAKAAIALIPELVKMAFAIQSWITTTGVPKLIELGGKLGVALIHGLVTGLGRLAAELGPVLTAELNKIRVDVGPFHLSAAGFSIDAPTIPRPSFTPPGVGGGDGGGGGSVPAFQHGGLFRVGGTGGPDSQMVRFRATPGEVVAVGHARAGHGAGTVNVNVNMGGVSVSNQADEERLVTRMVAEIESVFTDGLRGARSAGVRFPLGVSAPASG